MKPGIDVSLFDRTAASFASGVDSALAGDRHHLVIVGAGPLEEELRDFTRAKGIERVHWEGFVNQSRLPFYYRAADVLVLPSVVEPWGLW